MHKRGGGGWASSKYNFRDERKIGLWGGGPAFSPAKVRQRRDRARLFLSQTSKFYGKKRIWGVRERLCAARKLEKERSSKKKGQGGRVGGKKGASESRIDWGTELQLLWQKG